jgi:hypothetical protein
MRKLTLRCANVARKFRLVRASLRAQIPETETSLCPLELPTS